MLRFLTAGESHGPCLTAIIEGLPAGLVLTDDDINLDLRRRQSGYGRGGRQQIERDRVQFQAGLVDGRTIGGPLSVLVPNRDYENWKERQVPAWTRPRPGHADLAGSRKYDIDDMRLIAERASARSTAAQVAVGGAAKKLLSEVGIRVGSYVQSIGSASLPDADDIFGMGAKALEQRLTGAAESDVSCPDLDTAQLMRQAIDAARAEGDSLGGIFVIAALGVPVGLGSHAHWDRRLDGLLAQAVMGIQAIKGVEIGPAFANASLPGTKVHDPIYPGSPWPQRHTNRAGGIEGGMSTGEPILVRAAMKPIPTTIRPIATVDLATRIATVTEYTRSDVCAVPAAAVVGEAMVAWVLAQALLDRYGGDTVRDVIRRVAHDR